MCASSIPVPWNRFGIKSNFNSKVFSNTMQYKPWYPQVVSHINTFTRTNLVFPLKQKRQTVMNMHILLTGPRETRQLDVSLIFLITNLRKQLRLGDAITDFLVKQRLRIRYWWRVTTQILIAQRGKFALTNQKHYPDLGSDTSSVWNFCARSTDVFWWGNQ